MLLYGLDPPTEPVVGSEKVELDLGPETVAAVREHLARRVPAHGWGEHLDTATLCASELCTTLLALGCERIQLVISRCETRLTIEFQCGGAVRHVPELLGTSSDLARAFSVVDDLAPLWGIRPTDDGDAIWFEVG